MDVTSQILDDRAAGLCPSTAHGAGVALSLESGHRALLGIGYPSAMLALHLDPKAVCLSGRHSEEEVRDTHPHPLGLEAGSGDCGAVSPIGDCHEEGRGQTLPAGV